MTPITITIAPKSGDECGECPLIQRIGDLMPDTVCALFGQPLTSRTHQTPMRCTLCLIGCGRLVRLAAFREKSS